MKFRAKACYLICGANVTLAVLGAMCHILIPTAVGFIMSLVYWNLAETYTDLPKQGE